MNGYNEVIETVAWGLSQLGHQTSCALNHLDTRAINIIFGAQVLSMEDLDRLPRNSIIYNLEQMRNRTGAQIPFQWTYCTQHFKIWDYSPVNREFWGNWPQADVRIVPVAYAPVLTRIPRRAVQDVDVLIYGMPGAKRLTAFQNLCQSGLTVLFLCGLYGTARDELIARSKVVLNINLYDHAQVFEIVRVSYLFANRKAVVATRDPQTAVEADIESAVRFTTLEELAADCDHLVGNEAARSAQELKGFEIIVRRDIRNILRAAL